jgi:hypothetical protein
MTTYVDVHRATKRSLDEARDALEKALRLMDVTRRVVRETGATPAALCAVAAMEARMETARGILVFAGEDLDRLSASVVRTLGEILEGGK